MRIKVLFLLISMIVSNTVFAGEIPVKVKPSAKISTSDLKLQEGDSLNFVVVEDVWINSKIKLKKGQKVQAEVTSLEDNGFWVQPAKLYIENFRAYDEAHNLIKLSGIIYRSGSDHSKLTEFFVFESLRGGEVHITPQKDEFTIYIEENL